MLNFYCPYYIWCVFDKIIVILAIEWVINVVIRFIFILFEMFYIAEFVIDFECSFSLSKKM